VLQHLARDLCVTRLVGADETDDLQAGEEQESAESYKGQEFRGAARPIVKGARIGWFEPSECDDYCTLS